MLDKQKQVPSKPARQGRLHYGGKTFDAKNTKGDFFFNGSSGRKSSRAYERSGATSAGRGPATRPQQRRTIAFICRHETAARAGRAKRQRRSKGIAWCRICRRPDILNGTKCLGFTSCRPA